MSLDSFRANLKSKYTADKIASQHNVQISNGSRLILVPEIPVPLANRVIIVSKSMGSEQRGYSGLWGNSTGTNGKALRELCALRQLHHPRQHKNIWVPQKFARRELSKASNTSRTGIAKEDEGDIPVHVKKGEMDIMDGTLKKNTMETSVTRPQIWAKLPGRFTNSTRTRI